MKNIVSAILIACLAYAPVQAQDTEKKPLGWFISPEFSTMFLDDHVGAAVGLSFGVRLLHDHLKVGIHAYGRSGPINRQTFTVGASDGQIYRGSSELRLRADHGAFGLLLAPTARIGRLELDLPINFGMIAGGFYLFGEDRTTPDGERVSVWENRLMDERDAGFGTWTEVGLRTFFPSGLNGLRFGAGLHYTMTQGWETYYDPSGDFYNNKFRLALLLHFANPR